jgi:hypothetical protein
VKEALTTQATEEAVMEVDSEVPATRQELQDLIQGEATKIANKRIQQGISALSKAVLEEKNKRVPSTKGASQKRKSKVENNKAREAWPQTRTTPQKLEQNTRSNDGSEWTQVSNSRANNLR